jgi:hypothetical protein
MIPHKAIYKLYPTVRTIYGEWDARDQEGNVVEIDQDLVNAWIDPEAYKDKRFAEYPSIADQLDRLYHEGYDGWRASIQEIKDKYPKE